MKIEGCEISFVAIEPTIQSLDEYCEKVVLTLGVEARTLVLMIVPPILRCAITVFLLDTAVPLFFALS
jgi:hypothetical protein